MLFMGFVVKVYSVSDGVVVDVNRNS